MNKTSSYFTPLSHFRQVFLLAHPDLLFLKNTKALLLLRMRIMAILLAATLLSFSLPLAAQEEKPSFSLIPEPVHAQAGQGSFRLTKCSTICIPANQAELRKIARYFNGKLASSTGFS